MQIIVHVLYKLIMAALIDYSLKMGLNYVLYKKFSSQNVHGGVSATILDFPGKMSVR